MLDAVIAIEQRRDSAKAALEAAQKELETAYAKDIASGKDAEPPTNEVMDAQSRLAAIERLLAEARTEALALAAQARGPQQERLAKVGEEIVVIKSSIDERRVRSIAEFARKNGLRITWPTKAMGGSISLPAVGLDPEEIQGIGDSVATAREFDPQQGELDQLYGEKTLLTTMTMTGDPNIALDTLIEQKR